MFDIIFSQNCMFCIRNLIMHRPGIIHHSKRRERNVCNSVRLFRATLALIRSPSAIPFVSSKVLCYSKSSVWQSSYGWQLGKACQAIWYVCNLAFSCSDFWTLSSINDRDALVFEPYSGSLIRALVRWLCTLRRALLGLIQRESALRMASAEVGRVDAESSQEFGSRPECRAMQTLHCEENWQRLLLQFTALIELRVIQ